MLFSADIKITAIIEVNIMVKSELYIPHMTLDVLILSPIDNIIIILTLMIHKIRFSKVVQFI